MPRKKKTSDPRPITMDKRIQKILDESWIAPVYINAAIVELLNKFNAMSDEDLSRYMEGLVAPAMARAHVQEIYNRINFPKDE